MPNSKTITLAGLGITVIGVLLSAYGNMSSFVDEQGFLHENFAIPLGALSVLLGLAVIAVGLLPQLFRFFQKRPR